MSDECIAAVNELRSRRDADKPRFVIFKISDDERDVVVEEISPEKDYEFFLTRLSSAVDPKGKPAPRYAAYDVEYDLGDEGKRVATVFTAWVPAGTSIKSPLTERQVSHAIREYKGTATQSSQYR
ncbi:uncharacterized protein NECHADRAFT_84322 [Fusarium vanettenii 77-13-4]|uniref:Cofilin n=1 Tax=Fusarium vanettenii (strain ATCC MYA-4622 / CBS 123669 / FGSC 9596 / NRRL 45880 / 77-13-4) TaxID=660122 RepID=C7ZCS4_FUSV7|nr:uncharacterized protein NECHADRAFT_84322 [Fusarium vanettenii 77-13-4]EEU37971.1 hypothetical protein NECHADRAFT_84322 [Fusarium vanettenii 77-13-4]